MTTMESLLAKAHARRTRDAETVSKKLHKLHEALRRSGLAADAQQSAFQGYGMNSKQYEKASRDRTVASEKARKAHDDLDQASQDYRKHHSADPESYGAWLRRQGIEDPKREVVKPVHTGWVW